MPKPIPNPNSKSKNPTSTNPKNPTSCVLQSLHRLVSLNHLSSAVSALPLLSCGVFRPPLPILSLLLSKCLGSNLIPLARQLHLFLLLTSTNYTSHLPLSNHLISFHFALRKPDSARNLFDKMHTKNIFTYNSMLAGYSKLNMLPAARHLFDQIPHPDIVSYNTMIITFARNSQSRNAIELYKKMRSLGIGCNGFTLSGVVRACVAFGEVDLCRQVHGQVLKFGLGGNLVVGTGLVDAYAKCGWMEGARWVFGEMGERDVVGWTALVYGYAKSGEMGEARRVFEEMPERNPVSWTALIGGYVRVGMSFEGLELFRRMVEEGSRPDQFTFSSGLCACAAVAMGKQGREIHGRLLRVRFRANAIVLSSLVDMYSKCGDLGGGRRVFGQTPIGERDTVMWNTMMSVEGQHGHGREAIRLFEEMVEVGTKPDANSFVVLLTACSHSGLVAEGVQCFESMKEGHKIDPDEDHYSCLVDLFGRAGNLEKAVEWLSKMHHSSSSNPRVWYVLLGACRTHRNVKLGKIVAERLIELDPQNSASYVLLSNIYAEDKRWESVAKVRHLMDEKRVRKEHSASWIEVDNVIHTFGVSAQLHPLKDCIDGVLEHLPSQMGDTSFVT